MHKIFLAVSSMIVTDFLMKSYRKLREKPESNPGTKDELHRRMRTAYERLKIESRCADARATFNRMDGGLIDSLLQMSRGGSRD